MLELAGDRIDAKGDASLVSGDNMAASSNSRCRGARDKRTSLQMRMLRRLEVKGGWDQTAKHVPGVRNTPVDVISRWPRVTLADKVRELTNSVDWSEDDIGRAGKGYFRYRTTDKEISQRARRRLCGT